MEVINLLASKTKTPLPRTVFMFSIQIASTGPSNMSHCLSSSCELACFRNDTASTPSVHSWETGSKLPYNWPDNYKLGEQLQIRKSSQQPTAIKKMPCSDAASDL